MRTNRLNISSYDVTVTSNTSCRFYNAEEKVIPEIHSVAEFMAAQLGDCTGDKDNTFMTLRVHRIFIN